MVTEFNIKDGKEVTEEIATGNYDTDPRNETAQTPLNFTENHFLKTTNAKLFEALKRSTMNFIIYTFKLGMKKTYVLENSRR